MCNCVRNKELTRRILAEIDGVKTQKQIAEELGIHRNTVSKHINWLRRNVHPDNDAQLTLNRVDQALSPRIASMTTYELIALRKALTPTQHQAQVRFEGETKQTVEVTIPDLDERGLTAIIHNLINFPAEEDPDLDPTLSRREDRDEPGLDPTETASGDRAERSHP
jgi:hypothetical protein